MNTKTTYAEPQLNHSQIDATESQSECDQTSSVCYVEHYGYDPSQFAKQGDTISFNGIRVISPTDVSRAEFDNYDELSQSAWEVYPASAALLKDGTVLFEGHQ